MIKHPDTLTIQGDEFFRRGTPHRIFSGAIHYFRIVPECWEDRLRKCRACGLNTIETYVAWNFHEARPGEFDFSGGRDLRRFILLAGELGLDVILRPGPYICAEWDLGGFPSWLLTEKDIRLRCMNEAYLGAVRRYLKAVFDQVGDLQSSRGGHLVAVQIENEYGSYGNDHDYLSWLENELRSLGVEVLLFTSDGGEDAMLQGGTLPHVLKTVNFGSSYKSAFEKLRHYQPEGPLMCMEFWNGWFDTWGGEHHDRSPQDAAEVLDQMLSMGASVNFYMMHGGTNFGFWNGANIIEGYQPITSSYDYGAPLDEQGNPTEKYRLFRDVLAKYGAKVEAIPEATKGHSFGRGKILKSASLWNNLSRFAPGISSAIPLTMEALGQRFGWILYRTQISGPRSGEPLFIDGVHDRALVYGNQKLFGAIHRCDEQEGILLEVPEEGLALDILVENQGRVNYRNLMGEQKGILDGVRVRHQFQFGWEIFSLELSTEDFMACEDSFAPGDPTLFQFEIEIAKPHDTFLKVEGGSRGAVWLNGFALGRYDQRGPQKTLYVPASLLRRGTNSVDIFDEGSPQKIQVNFVASPILSALC